MEAIWRERMRELLEEPSVSLIASSPITIRRPGSPAFRSAVADFLSREYGWNLTSANVAVTNGGQSAFFFLLNRFAGAMADGSERRILLPLVPEYIGYGDQGSRLRPLRQPASGDRVDRRAQFQVSHRFRELAVDERHGAIAVSRPTNPSSNVLTDDEIARLRQIAAERGIPLIIDNAYGQPFPGVIFTEAWPVWDENVILTMSLSKLGLPGTRTGIVVAREEIISDNRSMTAIVGLANNNLGQALARPMIESGRIRTLAEEVVRPYYRHRAERALALAHEHSPPACPGGSTRARALSSSGSGSRISPSPAGNSTDA